MKKFPFYRQLDGTDAGAASLKMICAYHGRMVPIGKIREQLIVREGGFSLDKVSNMGEVLDMNTKITQMTYEDLKSNAPLPCIVQWRDQHCVIVYKITSKKVWMADPAHGLVTLSKEEFLDGFACLVDEDQPQGLVLILEPTNVFYEHDSDEDKQRKRGLRDYFVYLRPYKKYYANVLMSLALATVCTVTMPFLTQAVVDVGIGNRDIGFIYIVLFAQIMVFLSQKAGEVVRSWLLLHMTTRINISILSDFLIKLMRLPIAFFDRKSEGDLMQRLNDHQKIQSFFTASSLDFVFNASTVVVFGSVLAFYNPIIFAIYVVGSALYFLWIYVFLNKRKVLDYKAFEQSVLNHNLTLELINGMQEIKLQNCEKKKRWAWEHLQVRNFKLAIKQTLVAHSETVGSGIINELKNMLLSFYAAMLVIQGDMTVGMMLAISYIVGQLNWITPSLITFMHSIQEARLSIERLDEIHHHENEGEEGLVAEDIAEPQDLVLKNVSFGYGGQWDPKVFEWLHLTIPQGKVTAIVGSSGSGKTTLLKLLLKNYLPSTGEINYGSKNIRTIDYKTWRNKFASVMQESFVFPDTIAANIAVGEEIIDRDRLRKATENANIREFIEGLPMQYNTKIGKGGVGLSQGQRQRLLLARAMYKDSDILLLDEATNALDANNEKIIIENLNRFVKGKTVVVVAHRLSTVRDADQIIVLEKGQIVEMGNHEELVAKKGAYLNLIKNQLELAS